MRIKFQYSWWVIVQDAGVGNSGKCVNRILETREGAERLLNRDRAKFPNKRFLLYEEVDA